MHSIHQSILDLTYIGSGSSTLSEVSFDSASIYLTLNIVYCQQNGFVNNLITRKIIVHAELVLNLLLSFYLHIEIYIIFITSLKVIKLYPLLFNSLINILNSIKLFLQYLGSIFLYLG